VGTCNAEILAGITRERASPIEDFVNTHGDHSVRQVLLEVHDPTHFIERNPEFQADASRRGIRFVVPEPKRHRGGQSEFPRNPWVKGIDHIAIALTPDMMEQEGAWWENLGGKPTKKLDDVMPKDAPSSMMLHCYDFETFGVALIAGLDREKESQVTAFTRRHGAPFIQHVAYGVYDLSKFQSHLVRDLGGSMRGEILERPDDFGRGKIRQVFGAGFDEGDPAEVSFPEFVERPESRKGGEASITFSKQFGAGLYRQIEDARAKGERRTLVDFLRMPKDWEP
ncbi:MAG: hypothetical protein HYS15_01945, partial [Candidatus Spechtbacteria bacterium]|nr:hypothetical protein [Candidatus Spechtbacteria bacterium]